MTSQAMLSFVRETISDKVSLLATDDWVGYQDYLRKYPHESVDHSKHQYVVGAVHTNSIEGFWSIFKRGVVGTFHKVSANTCRYTSRSFSSAIITASTRISSTR